MTRTISEEELARRQAVGAVVLRKRAKPVPAPPEPVAQTSPPPEIDKISDVIQAAERSIAVADELRKRDSMLADKIAAALSSAGGMSYRFTVVRGEPLRNGVPGPIEYVDATPMSRDK